MNPTSRPQSHLFTMRLWMEELGDGQTEWRGKLRYVVNEEVRYFRDWQGLVALLQTMMEQMGTSSATGESGEAESADAPFEEDSTYQESTSHRP